jgi:hypothetical protein
MEPKTTPPKKVLRLRDPGPPADLTDEEEALFAAEDAFAKLEASYPEAVYDRWASDVAASEPWWAA